MSEQPGILQRIRDKEAAASPCEKHSDEKEGFCNPCRLEGINRENAATHKAKLAEACDRRFPRRFRDAKADNPSVLEWVENYLANPAEAKGLLLFGATGTGKTHQAYGALRLIGTHTKSYRQHKGDPFDRWTETYWDAFTMADLNASMRPGGDRDPENTLMRNRAMDLLLIDDLAAARTSEWVEEHLYRLINGRYEDMRPTMFTTNLDPAALRDALGDRMASRLAESCVRVVLDGPDRRRVKPAT